MPQDATNTQHSSPSNIHGSAASRQAAIAELLAAGWLKTVEWYESIDSTNTRARQLLGQATTLPLPALLLADEQTSGRGRSDRVWWSPRGCLMFTLVIDSATFIRTPGQHFPLSLLCGVALADAVNQVLGVEACQLKWPNDLYLHNKKLAGILIESLRPATAAGSGPAVSDESLWLIGVGLNVDIDWRQAPEEVRARATCLSDVAGQHLLPEVVLLAAIEQLHRWLAGTRDGSLHWLSGWGERCLLTGRMVRIRQGHPNLTDATTSILEGRCEGVDEQGHLLIRQRDALLPLAIGEVVSWER